MILPCEHPAAGPVRKWKTLRAFSKPGLARRLVHRPVVAGMLDQPAAHLHQPMPLAGQRPVLESLGATARIPCSGCMTVQPDIDPKNGFISGSPTTRELPKSMTLMRSMSPQIMKGRMIVNKVNFRFVRDPSEVGFQA
jgi:hypothetical protein